MSIQDHANDISAPILKFGTVWGAVGIANWADLAAAAQALAGFAAFIYSCILIGEWLWKKGGREYMQRRGWVKPKAKKSKAGA
jgi:hypothetical protein